MEKTPKKNPIELSFLNGNRLQRMRNYGKMNIQIDVLAVHGNQPKDEKEAAKYEFLLPIDTNNLVQSFEINRINRTPNRPESEYVDSLIKHFWNNLIKAYDQNNDNFPILKQYIDSIQDQKPHLIAEQATDPKITGLKSKLTKELKQSKVCLSEIPNLERTADQISRDSAVFLYIFREFKIYVARCLAD